MIHPDIYFSFFMFTTNLKPHDHSYRSVTAERIKKLRAMGYKGVEFPIAPSDNKFSFPEDLEGYANLRRYLDDQGLSDIEIATNVGATPKFDPSSSDPKVQQAALEYLKSRVDITSALRGEIMMGPIIVPYAAFPSRKDHTLIWSDELQSQLAIRYANAQPILNELGEYAEKRNVKLAIEPITHWETPGPNKLSQLIEFLKRVSSQSVGAVIDSAHEILDGEGPEIFEKQVKWLADERRLHYVQISPPDRGAVHTSWIPWQSFLKPILQVYDGPMAIEIFNALPEFTNLLRLTRRKFWIPGEDAENQYPSAYEIAEKAIHCTKTELHKWQPH